jgi:hypothetical protein
LFAFRHFAHLAFCAARMRALAAADIFGLLPLLMDTTFSFAFAHRAR